MLRDVTQIFQDSRDYLWLDDENGLLRYDAHNLTVYSNDPKDEKSISNNGVNSFVETSDGSLWIATNGGLNQYPSNTETFTRYPNTAKTHINELHKDHQLKPTK